MYKSIFLLPFFLGAITVFSQNTDYTYKPGDPNGIDKWYMGRQIARVMGYHGLDWLERPEREEEEKTAKLIRNLRLDEEDVVADIGAGSGYHVFHIAPLVPAGKVYAVDIQQEMLDYIKERLEKEGFRNIEPILGAEKDVNLPADKLDRVLMVDVYHEFEYPREMLASIKESLKPNGLVYLVEFRKEDEWVPIKPIHKMSREQAIKEFEASGFELERDMGNLPWQHCLVFRIP